MGQQFQKFEGIPRNSYKPRKSSCVNARGIPTAAYQVFHLLSVPGGTPAGGGYPIPAMGVPHLGHPHPTGPGRGTTPQLDLAAYCPLPPPRLDLAAIPPSPCGQTDGWMNRHVSVGTRSVIKEKYWKQEIRDCVIVVFTAFT